MRTCLLSRVVPQDDVSRCNIGYPEGGYSMTSSARASSVGGISRPSAFAVLRLITSSNLTDGKFARVLALRKTIGIGRAAPIIIELVNSVGQQAAEFSEDSARIDGREAVASCQRCDLCTMDGREGIRHHDPAAIRRAGLCGNDRFELGHVANGGCDRIHCKGRSGSFERVQVSLGI